MIKPLDLTIAIPVKNEEKNLFGCFAAIGDNFAAEIVVIDSDSTDSTCKIALDQGAKTINFRWNGEFPKKRNWFLRNYNLKTKWILFLDADEYLTEDFKNELRNTLSKSNENNVGYWLNYTIFFMGKKLKGGYPLTKLALFQVGLGQYERIDENEWSKLDMEVHEHPILNGKIGKIKSKIEHQDFRGISHYIIKHNEYSSWEAVRFLKSLQNEKLTELTLKQKIKYKLVKSPFIAPAYFFGNYIFLGGFRDGAIGFAFAVLKTAYFMQIYCKIKELEARKI